MSEVNLLRKPVNRVTAVGSAEPAGPDRREEGSERRPIDHERAAFPVLRVPDADPAGGVANLDTPSLYAAVGALMPSS